VDTFRIGRRRVGPGPGVFVIAEAGVNHDGDEAKARRLIRAARTAGADAVKFQVFDPDLLVTSDAATAAYQKGATGHRRQREMLVRLALSRDAFRRLATRARAEGIVFLATPFDLDALGFVKSLGVPAMKIGSGDLTNDPLLERAAATGLPVLLSTGMATLEEISHARRRLLRSGAQEPCLLHCVSLYPTPPECANLLGIRTLQKKFKGPVGFSDHTMSTAIPAFAVALGACVVEKHLTLDRRAQGPDHAASLEPEAFARMVGLVREAGAALGDGRRIPSGAERAVARVARRSLVLRREVPAGGVIRAADLIALRPAGGVPPTEVRRVVGRRACRRLAAGSVLRWDWIEE